MREQTNLQCGIFYKKTHLIYSAKSASYLKKKKKRTMFDQCSESEMILSSGGHLTKSGDIFDHHVKSAAGI